VSPFNPKISFNDSNGNNTSNSQRHPFVPAAPTRYQCAGNEIKYRLTEFDILIPTPEAFGVTIKINKIFAFARKRQQSWRPPSGPSFPSHLRAAGLLLHLILILNDGGFLITSASTFSSSSFCGATVVAATRVI